MNFSTVECDSTQSSGSTLLMLQESRHDLIYIFVYFIVPNVDWRGIDVIGELPQPLFIGYVIVQLADMDL